MGNNFTKDDYVGSKFVAEKRMKILEIPLDEEEEKIYKVKLSEWRRNETEDQLKKWRQKYICREDQIINIKDIPKWNDIGWSAPFDLKKLYDIDEELNNRISLFRCNITHLEIDCIVNAANNMLLGGGGIDGAIHSCAGPLLLRECAELNGLKTGAAKITKGYNLPTRFIIHTVGPTEEIPEDLESCYVKVLQLAMKNQIKTLAFCCISTGIYGYPLGRATQIALQAVREFLTKPISSSQQNRRYNLFERIIFVTFLAREEKIYHELLPVFFPVRNPKPVPQDPVEIERKLEEEKRKAKEEELMNRKISENETNTNPSIATKVTQEGVGTINNEISNETLKETDTAAATTTTATTTTATTTTTTTASSTTTTAATTATTTMETEDKEVPNESDKSLKELE